MTTPATLEEARAAVLAANPKATEEEIIEALSVTPAPEYLQVPPRYQRVPAKFFRNLLLRTGELARVKFASEPGPPEGLEVRGLALVVLGLLEADDEPVDFLDERVRNAFTQSLGKLAQIGLVSQDSALEMLARCQPPQSWAYHTGLSPVPKVEEKPEGPIDQPIEESSVP